MSTTLHVMVTDDNEDWSQATSTVLVTDTPKTLNTWILWQ